MNCKNADRGPSAQAIARRPILRPNASPLVLLLAVAVSLSACGGGGGENSQAPAPASPPTPPNPLVINGIAVPPDPGPAGNSTVTGIDSDSNGIRDDIDRFIATKYGLNATAMKAARASAKASQQMLVADARNKVVARVVLQDSANAGICAGEDFEAAGFFPERELNEIFLRSYNTQARIAQYKSVTAIAGTFFHSSTSVVCQ